MKASSSKGRKERALPLSEGLLQVLTDWRTSLGPGSPQQHTLAWSLDTMGPFYEEWRVLLAAADLPDEAYDTPKYSRSTCASALIASNVPTVGEHVSRSPQSRVGSTGRCAIKRWLAGFFVSKCD